MPGLETVRQLRHVVERVAISAGNKPTISAREVSEALEEMRRFETPSEIPLGYSEEIRSMNSCLELPYVFITIC